MDKIVRVIFEEWQDVAYADEGLMAWHYGQILQVEGLTLLDGNIEVHFSLTEREGDANVYIGSVKDNILTVDIPDFIFQKEDVYQSTYDAYAFIYQTDGASGRTIKKIIFTIQARPEPTTDVPEDKKDPFLEEVRKVMAETKDIAQSVRDDADNGKFSGIPGDKGEDGKSAYEYAVEGGFKGTEEEFTELIARAGQVDLTGYVTKEEHEAELLKAFVKVTTDKADFHHITDSANMKVLDFGMEGKTEQKTTEGNQLFDISKFVSSNGRINNGDGSITITKYAIDGVNKISECCPNIKVGQTVIIYATNGTLVYFGGTVKNISKTSYITVTQSMLDNNMFDFYGGADGENEEITISNIMINEGTTALPYEPYTNGPSPNPDYKQEVKNAGVYNEETGRYEHKGEIRSIENLWDREYASDINNWEENTITSYPQIPIFVGKGNTVTISYNEGVQSGIKNLYVAVAIKKDGNNNKWLYHSQNVDLTNRSVVVKSQDGYVYIRVISNALKDGSFMQHIGNNLKIEYGSVETEYKEYQGIKFTLTSDRPLTKWDPLIKRDGVWGWSIQAKEYIKSAEESNIEPNNPNAERIRIYINNIEGPNNTECLCNLFRTSQTISYEGVWGIWWANIICGYVPNELLKPYGYTYDSASTENVTNAKAAFKALLAEKGPIRVWVDMQEEQSFHPLPDEEQELLNNLETYYGVTNVYNDQGCPMWLTYVADTKLYIDQKLLEIQQAII